MACTLFDTIFSHLYGDSMHTLRLNVNHQRALLGHLRIRLIVHLIECIVRRAQPSAKIRFKDFSSSLTVPTFVTGSQSFGE
ncbi:unnamed protein product [Protopolystoma xenopodis]|uniref:Uncharacterized protein n=1 Tax=Protopolystoma xenopodis TaxID=117903 RepID=A0A3S5BDV9_9PLAT|nr:unnamed protein product [Protopolystoma xenopodis]